MEPEPGPATLFETIAEEEATADATATASTSGTFSTPDFGAFSLDRD